MSHPKILVSGCGIAGAVFAHWMLRANPNAQITIVERDPALRLTGASVDIRSSAVDIIKWMNAEQEIRKHTTKEEGVQWLHADGSPIATMRASGHTDIQTMTSEFEIFRGALAKVFLDPILDKINVLFNETVETYEEADNGVHVTFANSKETRKYDILVASDGLGSRIRGLMLDAPPRTQIYDEGVHIAFFTITKDLLQGSKLAKWHNTTLGRCVFLRPDPHPDGRVRAHLMTVRTRSNVATKKRLDDAVAAGNAAYMDAMDDMYSDVGWLARDVLAGMRTSDDFYCTLFGQVRAPALCASRVVLLGDAGYATPGMGTSLAIMGGYVLAGELLTTPDDVTGALRRYEALMLPFVKGHQGGAGDWAMQCLVPQTAWGISIRNVVLSTVFGLGIDRLMLRVATWLGFTEKKLPMPDYKWPPVPTEEAVGEER